jgi:hypothetical protein
MPIIKQGRKWVWVKAKAEHILCFVHVISRELINLKTKQMTGTTPEHLHIGWQDENVTLCGDSLGSEWAVKGPVDLAGPYTLFMVGCSMCLERYQRLIHEY